MLTLASLKANVNVSFSVRLMLMLASLKGYLLTVGVSTLHRVDFLSLSADGGRSAGFINLLFLLICCEKQ